MPILGTPSMRAQEISQGMETLQAGYWSSGGLSDEVIVVGQETVQLRQPRLVRRVV
jgi:hypothetical protein